jgi:hypothetical protein
VIDSQRHVDTLAEFGDASVLVLQRRLARRRAGPHGPEDAPNAFVAGITPARVGAVALSVGLTGGVLRLLRSAHPPAGATTIIVSSGLLADPDQMLAVAVGVVLLTVACWLLNRAIGVPAPAWAAPA